MKEKTEISTDFLHKFGKMIQETLVLSQRSFGQFITKTRYAVNLPNIKDRDKWQENLDHGASLLAICHVMSIFEDVFPQNYWKEFVVDKNDYESLMAYKHIRNCAVNGFTGKRELDDIKERGLFNKVMSSENKLRGVISYSSRRFRLAGMAAYDANVFITSVSNKIYVELYKKIHYGGGQK